MKGFIVNFRHFLMSSNLSMYIKNKNPKFLLFFSQYITDETFAVNYNNFENNEWSDQNAMILNLMANIICVVSNGLGGYLGEVIKINDTIAGFVLTSMSIALLMMQVKDRVHIAVAVSTVLVSIITYSILKNSLYVVIASIIGAALGFYIDKRKGKITNE
ncbi:MAG: AzlC family ABC transporter permease [Clostridioides sp.]|jgi:predicted branched-subunit amino acid permease|nr:AzlC family ABC transporter permease [Clostridioides sp.]